MSTTSSSTPAVPTQQNLDGNNKLTGSLSSVHVDLPQDYPNDRLHHDTPVSNKVGCL